MIRLQFKICTTVIPIVLLFLLHVLRDCGESINMGGGRKWLVITRNFMTSLIF
jgi:hypothetical protein